MPFRDGSGLASTSLLDRSCNAIRFLVFLDPGAIIFSIEFEAIEMWSIECCYLK